MDKSIGSTETSSDIIFHTYKREKSKDFEQKYYGFLFERKKIDNDWTKTDCIQFYMSFHYHILSFVFFLLRHLKIEGAPLFAEGPVGHF